MRINERTVRGYADNNIEAKQFGCLIVAAEYIFFTAAINRNIPGNGELFHQIIRIVGSSGDGEVKSTLIEAFHMMLQKAFSAGLLHDFPGKSGAGHSRLCNNSNVGD